MPLVQLVVILIVVGVLLGMVNRYIPMAGSIKSILNGSKVPAPLPLFDKYPELKTVAVAEIPQDLTSEPRLFS